MKSFKLICTLLCVFLFIQLSYQCHHDNLDIEVETLNDEDVDPEGTANRRFLASSYGPLRIHADFSHFSGSSSTKSYIQNKLLPAAISYFASALQVARLTSLKTSSSSVCGLRVPSVYKSSGVQADLVFMVTGERSSQSWLAWAKPCSSLSNGRPIFGQINFNLNDMAASSSDSKFEADLMVVMHEMTHVLGVSQSLFGKYVNPARISSKSVGGSTYYYVDVAPLTQRLRNHFGCSTIPGAFLENNGGSGSAGSHFERKFFNTEYMTASAITDARISEFTLAMLEGSGWYKVNYDMADNFQWGKGEGCDFFSGACSSTNADEFCSGSGSYGCTYHRSYGGYCTNSDSFGGGCSVIKAYANQNCEDSASRGSARISGEFYGQGSKCFTGTLYSGGSLSRKYPFCLKNECQKQSNGNYAVKLTVGSASATCTSKGSVKISGYSGSVDCPDPNEFCTGVGKKTCKRGCMGNGDCSNGKCICNSGWRGLDCGIPSGSFIQADEPEYAPGVDPNDVIPDGDNIQVEPAVYAPPFDPNDVIPDSKN